MSRALNWQHSKDYLRKDATMFDVKNSQNKINNTVAKVKSNLSSYGVPHYEPVSFKPNDRIKD
jgi:hypothetical protein